MPVKKVFWEDPYLTDLTAKVTGATGDLITLDRTIAYAFSGGQSSDEGTIGGFPILCAELRDKEIYYTLESNHDLLKGREVQIKIDWAKRYRLMKLHFAAELILELVNQNYGNPEKLGANITDTKARLDFVREGNISETFDLLNQQVQAIIERDQEIISGFSDRDNEIRFWEIKGFAKVPCCGTHLKRTGEIGNIKLKRNNRGNGQERIEITLTDL
ncbi:MAG: alanyl-tRNA editing protein [Peptococcaceae bacterium]